MKTETKVTINSDGITAFARVYYERVLSHAIDDELVETIRKAAHDIVKNSPELQEEIRLKALEYINVKFGLEIKQL